MKVDINTAMLVVVGLEVDGVPAGTFEAVASPEGPIQQFEVMPDHFLPAGSYEESAAAVVAAVRSELLRRKITLRISSGRFQLRLTADHPS